MAVRKMSVCGLIAILTSVVAWHCYAQYQIEPEARQARAYRVRVINQMDRDICVKIIPYGRSGYFHADLDPGESETEDLWAGQRVLCVWDDNTGRLLIASGLTVNRNGKLRIRPLFAALPKTTDPEGAQRRAAPGVPLMEIEPD